MTAGKDSMYIEFIVDDLYMFVCDKLNSMKHSKNNHYHYMGMYNAITDKCSNNYITRDIYSLWDVPHTVTHNLVTFKFDSGVVLYISRDVAYLGQLCSSVPPQFDNTFAFVEFFKSAMLCESLTEMQSITRKLVMFSNSSINAILKSVFSIETVEQHDENYINTYTIQKELSDFSESSKLNQEKRLKIKIFLSNMATSIKAHTPKINKDVSVVSVKQ